MPSAVYCINARFNAAPKYISIHQEKLLKKYDIKEERTLKRKGKTYAFLGGIRPITPSLSILFDPPTGHKCSFFYPFRGIDTM